jgi:hypothetical protein
VYHSCGFSDIITCSITFATSSGGSDDNHENDNTNNNNNFNKNKNNKVF